MHRLISARNLYQSNIHGIALPSNNALKSLAPVSQCSFCRKIFLAEHYTVPGNVFVVRHQSTRTANAMKSVKKKSRHKSYKKYGEVMEVNESSMTETKVSISKLHAKHLSKLASSPVNLGQLHQLTTKPLKKSPIDEVDPELLRSVKEKILKKNLPSISSGINLEDDKCALIFTSHKISALENRCKTKQYIDMVKESYYSFRKATLYDQKLQDLRYAINEGVNQEFDLEPSDPVSGPSERSLPKSPHAVFRELFVDNNQLDGYDRELFNHLSNLQYQGIPHPALDDICEDNLHTEIDIKDDLELENERQHIEKTLKVKKAQQAIKQKKKKQREKRRQAQELSMKQDARELERRGKRDALHRLLAAHLQLLCSLHMIAEGRQVLQYYRQKSTRADQPKITDVKVYNTLLHGHAFMGNLEGTKELMTFMSEDGVDANAQTYAALFECVERSSVEDKFSVLNNYRQKMLQKGISLNDLLDKTKFQYDQQEMVLRAVRRLQPDFEPQYTPPLLDYDCPLLEDLKLDNIENRKGLLISPAENLLTLEELKLKGKEQLAMEINGEIEVENISATKKELPSVNKYREKLQETESEWRTVIKEAFIRNLSTLRSRSSASHTAITLYPYLKVLDADQFVELMMIEIRKLIDGSESYSPTLKLLQRDLGTQVYQKYQIKQRRSNGVLAKLERVYEQYLQWYLAREPLDGAVCNARQAWQLLLHRDRHGASLDIEEYPWPVEIRQNIGKFLYNIIINDIKIDVNMFKSKAKPKRLPAVYKVHRPWGRQVRLELKPHPALARLWAAAAAPALRMRTALAPQAAPPAPWLGPTRGAYLLTDTPLIRMPIHMTSQTKLLDEAPPGSLHPVLDSLNQLGEVPWLINKPILDLQLQVFRSGGDKRLDIAPPASSLDTSQFPVATGAGAGAGATLKRRLAISRARADMHSLWCDALYKLSLANHYRDRMFWLPHNMDFRGRVYAVGPHVSVLGADAARALLRLARAQPLGPTGLRWLKLHAVNLTGTMKRNTIDERYQYAESIMDKILDSADHPLDGKGWWKESEEPWQTLACCMEIAKAVRSPNPEEYMCGFPVHQDGSCNGLQHYAALGRDAPGAAAVNLAPRHRPHDVYTDVAALVEKQRARDAAAGVAAAATLEGFVRRKVIKQTVMTTVYGVTRFGARLQIAKQLKDIEEFPKEHVWTCSHYLTAKTFDSLREMFTSTKLIQDWFTDCAKMIAGVCGESVRWRTPLGLPVLQPYYRRAPHDAAQRPCTMKQRNAFPPNFIHSLDSSHMMLTGLRCQAAGLAFVSVHDCFWTHPNSVDAMNKICREQFVALHSQPILEDLSDFLVKQYSYPESEIDELAAGSANKRRVNSLLRAVPDKGQFDIRDVLRSVYFFS
ncbi:DNA-directed RNA polymerase, mitochondrial [Epargyreus clarus]|uniref:DNA-directed RNA polymerase, mitochondrial n=1 Tax=Epargyreus clarus TaxID=520877 RepID=UPI003C2E73DE